MREVDIIKIKVDGKAVKQYSDGSICRTKDKIVVKDNARVLEIHYDNSSIRNLIVCKVLVDGIEYPVFTDNRVITMDHTYTSYPILRSEKWAVQAPCSSTNYAHRCSDGGYEGAVNWSEFIDFVLDKEDMDSYMDNFLREKKKV